MASWVIVRSQIRLRVLCAGVSTGGVLGERMPKSAIRWDLRGGLVMGMGVGIMRVSVEALVVPVFLHSFCYVRCAR